MGQLRMLKSLDYDELKNLIENLKYRFLIRIVECWCKWSFFWIESVSNIFAKCVDVSI